MLRLLVLVASLFIAALAHAQPASDPATYPNRPVRVIVPFGPGGVTDVVARVWAQGLTKNLGQNFFVENLAGGGSNIGMGNAARAPADGYTILIGASSYTINPGLYHKIPYDPAKDFTAVTMLAATPNVLVVHPSLPANNVKELIALLRANPGKYSYAMSGLGTPNHLQAELFKLTQKVDLITVPFAGGGPAIQSTVAGHTPIAFTSLTSVQTLVAGGQLRALAVSSKTRAPAWPDVPTMAEAGITGQEADTFTGVLVPAGTPQAIIDRLHAETVKILGTDEAKQQFAKFGAVAVGNTPAEFAAQLKDEVAFWGKVIDEAKIQKQ
jgi:tripartite-type tricarboxylate transporter receptor subunit TctC